MKIIKFLNLNRSYGQISKKLNKKIFKFFSDADFVLGNDLKKFEKKISKFFSVKYCSGVNSGTDALVIILRSLNISYGDEVIIPSHTYASTAFACSLVGAKPVFVDINEDDFNINTNLIQKKISKRTKAIICVHMYGQMCDMEALKKISSKNKIFLIEDAAQAHGSLFKKKNVGYYSTAAALSFYPGKNLGAFGDGGAIISNNYNLNKKFNLIRNIGSCKRYVHDVVGLNSRLDNLQAVILSEKLKFLKKNNEARNEIAKLYDKNICNKKILKPNIKPMRYHVFHLYVLRVKNNKRNSFIKYMRNKGIICLVHYPKLIAKQKAYKSKENFPVAEKIVKEIVSIPIDPFLKSGDIKKIINEINSF